MRINLKAHQPRHVVRYLLFLSRGWLSFEDAGIHGLDVLNHQAKQLVTETEHELREGGKQEDDQEASGETSSTTEQLNVGINVCVCV